MRWDVGVRVAVVVGLWSVVAGGDATLPGRDAGEKAPPRRDPCREPVTLSARASPDEDSLELKRMAADHLRLAGEAMQRREFPLAIKEHKKSYLLRRDPVLLHGIAGIYGACLGDVPNALYYARKYLQEAAGKDDALRYRDDARDLIERLSAAKARQEPAR